MNRDALQKAAILQIEYHQMMAMFFSLETPSEEAVREIVALWAKQLDEVSKGLNAALFKQPAQILEFRR